MVTMKISVSIKNAYKGQYKYRDKVGYGMALGKLIEQGKKGEQRN